jgi:O-antigen/teichoic acid export membrane protein
MELDRFGAVLSAQALYALLQIAVDNGSAAHGARLKAADDLDDRARASLVRARLQLSGPASLVMLGVGLAGGHDLLMASAPFVLALLLFALLNVWEPYGTGNTAPWSAYVVLRTSGIAIAALVYLAAGASMPTVVAGIAECLIILVVASVFRLGIAARFLEAFGASPAPWKTLVQIGGTAVLGQVTLAAGTLMLVMFGKPAAAAVLAVSVRLLAGVNGVFGVLVTALFPRFARAQSDPSGAWDATYERMASVALDLLTVLAFVCGAGASLLAPQLAHAFIGHSDDTAAVALVLVGLATMPTGLIMLMTSVLVAKRAEARTVTPYAIAATVAIAGSLVALTALDAGAEELAALILFAQAVSAVVVTRRTAKLIPALAPRLRQSLLIVVLLGACGGLLVLSSHARVPLGVTLGVGSVIVGTWGMHRRHEWRAALSQA